MNLKKLFKNCRNAGVPLVGIETAEPASTVRTILASLNGKQNDIPIIEWDLVRASRGLTEKGKEIVQAICGENDPKMVTRNPVDFLDMMVQVPENQIVIMHNANKGFAGEGFSQAVWNLRDSFKQTGATLVLLGSMGWKLPAELVNDVVMLADDLPEDDEIVTIIADLLKDAGLEVNEDDKARAVDAVAGLSSFAVEQSVAMSLDKSGIRVDDLWNRKRKSIEQTKGIRCHRGDESFKDVRGYTQVKDYFTKVKGNKNQRYRCIVWIDEVEKHFAGNAGDLSGTSQEMTGAICSWFQETKTNGVMFYGVAGSGKSAMAKALASEFGVPLIALDFSGLKGSLQGESGQNLRSALASIDAIGRGRVLVVSTCNGMAVLAPEMRRRLGSLGIWFFDLPTAEERKGIWEIWLAKSGLKADQEMPDDRGWTGAEISQCCFQSVMMECSLIEASKKVVPVCKSSADIIEGQRRQASGKFLNASLEGVYRYEPEAPSANGGRKMQV